ncbi:MAG: hypothetical protein HQK51_14795 [Oligoflexia bacterium]|nr:hypothetical protein [Oligoflexia bacterium]
MKNNLGLFLDTTFYMIIGLLNENNKWIDYYHSNEQKSSALIHKQIDEIIKKNNFKKEAINRVIHVAGPGSYTGVRVSRGISEVFALLDRQVFSFYHFDVPKYLEIKKGLWFAKAFKGEFFVYEWNYNNIENKYITQKSLKKKQSFFEYIDWLLNRSQEQQQDNKTKLKLFTHYKDEIFNEEDTKNILTGILTANDCAIEETSSMIKENSDKLLSLIQKNAIQDEPYYYRSLDDEFRSFKN